MLVQRRQYRAAELEFRKVVAGNERDRGFDDIRTPDNVVCLIMNIWKPRKVCGSRRTRR